MTDIKQHTIYTIGHSMHPAGEFIAMLQSFGVRTLVDIRSLPGSRKYPHFNKENLAAILPENGIKYIYMEGLGGRRKVSHDSKNTRWRNASFRGYADYMDTAAFENALAELENIAAQAPTAYMCAESVPWRCHRSMVSDRLKAAGWRVMHITGAGKAHEHSYTSPAIVAQNTVSYKD